MGGNILDFLIELDKSEILMGRLLYNIYSSETDPGCVTNIINEFIKKESGLDYYTVSLSRRVEEAIHAIAISIINRDAVSLKENIDKLDSMRINNIPECSPGFVRFFICQAWLYCMNIRMLTVYKCKICGKIFPARRKNTHMYCTLQCKNTSGQRDRRRREKEKQNDKN